MTVNLSALEARVIGSLIEKEITTPEQYPLSLNSLTNACNQKSNRDPVLQLAEVVVQQTLDDLIKKRLVSEKTGFGSRVSKYQHRFCNSEFGELKFSPQELGVICELLLRGPQTPGELRSNAARLCKLSDVSEVELVLKQLIERSDGPFIMKLAREPGKRESRYAQCFTDISVSEHTASTNLPEKSDSQADRIDQLEMRINELNEEVNRLKTELEQLKSKLAN